MAKFVVLVALALIVSSVQCTAACTPVSSAPQPPCHHHKQAPKACAHELVPATTIQSFALTVFLSPEPLESLPVSGSEVQTFQDASPPVLTAPPLDVLRI